MEIKIQSQTLKILIFTFPAIFGAFMYWLATYYFDIYVIIGTEDHIIEYAQFFFFLAGGILAFLISLKFKSVSRLMFAIFLFISIGLIFVAGEEISWGERIFNINAPEIFDGESTVPLLEYNVQGEMNLHNFKPIHNIVGILYLLIGAYFIFAWPLRRFLEKKNILKDKVKFFASFLTSPPLLILYFIPTGINLLNRRELQIIPQNYEMVEFLFSLGILIFLIFVYSSVRKGIKLSNTV